MGPSLPLLNLSPPYPLESGCALALFFLPLSTAKTTLPVTPKKQTARTTTRTRSSSGHRVSLNSSRSGGEQDFWQSVQEQASNPGYDSLHGVRDSLNG